MKKLIALFAMLLILVCTQVMAVPPSWTGSGTLAVQYEIETAADLIFLSTNDMVSGAICKQTVTNK